MKKIEIIATGRKGAIVTIVDRKSMFLKVFIPCSKNSKIIAKKISWVENSYEVFHQKEAG